MFTGIVEELGEVRQVRRGVHSAVLEIGAARVLEDLRVGDSVAVNGVCLTVTSLSGAGFSADVMHETLNRSALSVLTPGNRVNLERALALGGRLGGHIVTGHIDGTGVIAGVKRDDNALWYTVRAAPSLLRYVAEKGSIAVDGISLTVAGVSGGTFSVSLIPHTAAHTTLGGKGRGDLVNLENDCIAKYVEKLLSPARPAGAAGMTREFLAQYGF